MRRIFRHWHIAGILSIPLQGMIYVWIGRDVGSIAHLDYSWLDARIPFDKWFILPYMSWMPILYLSFLFFALRDRRVYWRILITYNLAVMASNLIFWLYPTFVPRPAIHHTDVISMLVQFLYRSDEPFNCFPSIHVLTSYLLFITIQRNIQVPPVLRTVWSILLWLIIASTVLIKQHSLLDVAGGILFAEATYWIVHYARVFFSIQEKQPSAVSGS